MNIGVEKRKIAIDLYKHLATVSTAGLAVCAALLSDLSAGQLGTQLIPFVAAGLGVCILASIVAITILLANLERYGEKIGTTTNTVLRVASALVLLGFVVGVGALAVALVDSVK
ncbi:MAG: hypothetical protein ACJAYC_001175 [Halieaceae bacterium]|jgi:hypothetical protein